MWFVAEEKVVAAKKEVVAAEDKVEKWNKIKGRS